MHIRQPTDVLRTSSLHTPNTEHLSASPGSRAHGGANMQRITPSAAKLAVVSIFFMTSAALVGSPATPASATSSGSNGKIAFVDWDNCDSQACTSIEIFSINPNGSG